MTRSRARTATPRPSPDRRLALVTGASQGLGKVVARFLGGNGYDLLLTARREEVLRGAGEELRGLGVRIETIAGNVGDPRHQRRLRAVVAKAGHLEVLFNGASELGPSPLPPLATYPLAELGRVYAINAVAPVALVQLLLPWLECSQGWVVNVSSDAAVGGYPGWAGYGASKAALDLLSRTLANELQDRGVTVVSVDPGDMRTAMHQAAYPTEDISDRPPPEVTLPFWAWLFEQDGPKVTAQRYRAQADRWEVPA